MCINYHLLNKEAKALILIEELPAFVITVRVMGLDPPGAVGLPEVNLPTVGDTGTLGY